MHCVEHGRGVPVVALHGAGVDHCEIEAAIVPIVPGTGYRRIYPDLPGMGRSTSRELNKQQRCASLLGDLIERLVEGPVLLLGHSYGAYLARGIAARRPDMVLGLALLCPVGEPSHPVPEHTAVREDSDAYDELDSVQREGFDEHFRYPHGGDESALARIFAGWKVDVGSDLSMPPTLIVAGRRDSVVGHTDAIDLVEHYRTPASP